MDEFSFHKKTPSVIGESRGQLVQLGGQDSVADMATPCSRSSAHPLPLVRVLLDSSGNFTLFIFYLVTCDT